ncbi:MAG: potassium/proton antiporter [Candidatus Nanopelagicales bacterium]|nr:potassium/proton antiporter [Candidatus Nanopelagicales bacterium]
MDLSALADYLLIGAVIVLVAVVGVRVTSRLGIPGLLLYLALGLGLGAAFPSMRLDDAMLGAVLGYAALVIILSEGGLTTRLEDLRPVLWPSVALATVGVAVSISVVAGALIWIAGVDARTATLIGAVVAATDAAAVFSVLRRLRLHPRLRSLLEAEAGFNDAPVVVLVVVVSAPDFDPGSAWMVPLIVLAEIIGGAIVGIGVGWIARQALPRLALPASGLYPIAVMSVLVGAYGLASVLHTSGFMATYVAAVLVGSSRELPHRQSVVGFAEGLAWTAQIGLFIMLGLLADPQRAVSAIVPAIVAGATLLVFARPVSVLLSLGFAGLPKRWVAFTGVAGLRGAVPIVFAAIPLGLGVPGSEIVFDTTLILVVLLTLIQTPLLPWAGRRLGVGEPGQADELDVEAAPLDRMKASLLGVDVSLGSLIAGLYLADLRLPEGASVSLVVRDGTGFVPGAHTRFRVGDRLLIVATSEVRSRAERRLRAVSRGGRLVDWDKPDAG